MNILIHKENSVLKFGALFPEAKFEGWECGTYIGHYSFKKKVSIRKIETIFKANKIQFEKTN
jgi:hypothetical protein